MRGVKKAFESTKEEYEEMFEGATKNKEGGQNTSPPLNPISL